MNRDKQIEEMARDLCECYNCDGTCYQDDKPCDLKCDEYTNAQYLYEKGYRKASDVAREIFEEIEKIRAKEILRCEILRENESDLSERKYWEGGEHSLRQFTYWFNELKKKYTS